MNIWRVVTDYFCCALNEVNGIITEAAPIMKWSEGKNITEVSKWVAGKEGTIELLGVQTRSPDDFDAV